MECLLNNNGTLHGMSRYGPTDARVELYFLFGRLKYYSGRSAHQKQVPIVIDDDVHRNAT